MQVIHTPGHAPDHICLVDEVAGILFAQDQAYYGPQLIRERAWTSRPTRDRCGAWPTS